MLEALFSFFEPRAWPQRRQNLDSEYSVELRTQALEPECLVLCPSSANCVVLGKSLPSLCLSFLICEMSIMIALHQVA